MIRSAEEFKRLRESEIEDEYRRAAHEEAPVEVWNEVIEMFPDLRFWVAQNKTVPLPVLETLARDKDPKVRGMVARKRKIVNSNIFSILAKDADENVRHDLSCNSKLSTERFDEITKDGTAWFQNAMTERKAYIKNRK